MKNTGRIETPDSELVQGSEEWKARRSRKLSGTRFHKVLHGGAATWISLHKELVHGTTFTGNKYTEWGHTHEPDAIAMFEMMEGVDVIERGWMTHPDNMLIGGSPDGLIGDNSGIEIKCPYNPVYHEEVYLSKQMPRKYEAQVRGYQMISNREYWWFVSHNAREPDPAKRQVRLLITHDKEYSARLYARCLDFIQWWKDEDGDPDKLEKYFPKSKDLDGSLPDLF